LIGVSVIFTSAEQDEVIRLWDVRAAKLVYELSKGNNQVTSMAWDSERSVLYTSTDCDYMDRYGNTTGYHTAKVPKSGDENDEDEDDDDDNDYPQYWPRKTAHAEEYVGHLLDAGDHHICDSFSSNFPKILSVHNICAVRYTFKNQPDPIILPTYGDATARSRSYW
jgi:WD40 repeat protein